MACVVISIRICLSSLSPVQGLAILQCQKFKQWNLFTEITKLLVRFPLNPVLIAYNSPTFGCGSGASIMLGKDLQHVEDKAGQRDHCKCSLTMFAGFPHRYPGANSGRDPLLTNGFYCGQTIFNTAKLVR